MSGKRYQAEKKAVGNPQFPQNEGIDNDGETAERLADEYNVSRPTIERDAAFAEAVDAIGMSGKGDPKSN